jgi:ABC-type nitrate/sulfonate/bicarbonate transport system ATPase subunit
LLLDEPLGALDAFTRMHIQDELLEIRKKYDSTMLMITHDIDEAVYLSDIVVVMTPRPGRVNRVIPVDMPHPRNRSAEEFVEIRNLILRTLHYATE